MRINARKCRWTATREVPDVSITARQWLSRPGWRAAAGDAIAFVRQPVGKYWTYLGMTQTADNDIERLLAMVRTQAQDAAEILARKREHNPRVHETWLGQLWRWMTRAELQVRLDGLSVRVAAGRRSIGEEAGRYSDTERELVQRGCDVLGVQWVTDLLCRDGQHVRPEMAVGGRTSAP